MNPTYNQYPMVHRILSAVAAFAMVATLLPNNVAAEQVGSENNNPNPEPCCSCFVISVDGLTSGAQVNTLSPKDGTDGEYDVNVNVFYQDATTNSDCEDSITVTVTAEVVNSGSVVTGTKMTKTVIVGETLKKGVAEFVLSAENAKKGDTLRIKATCKDGGTPDGTSGEPSGQLWYYCPEIDLNLGGGCSSCQSETAPCDAQTATDSFKVTIPTNKSNGGMTDGELIFYTEQFANPGLQALKANVPSDFQVQKDVGTGYITSINTGAGIIEVAPAEAGLLALDPNAFVVIHKDPAGAVYRRTWISKVNEGGMDRLRMDTRFDGETRRHEQIQPQAGTLITERGAVIGGSYDPVTLERLTFTPLPFESLTRETLVKDTSNPGVVIKRRTMQERPNTATAWSTSSDIEEKWEQQVEDWVKTREIIDPDGEALTSTWVYYQPGDTTGPSASTVGVGELKQHTRYDGYQSLHIYGPNYHSVTTPYAGNVAGKVTETTWNPGTQTRTTITTVGGKTLSKTETIHNGPTIISKVYTASGAALTTTTTHEESGNDFGGRPIKVQHPDGTLTTYAYSRLAGGGYTTVMDNGSTTDGNTVAKGMRTTTTTNSRGVTILSKTEAIGYGTGSAVYGSMAVTSIDNLGRALVTAYHPEAASATGEQATATNPAWTTSVSYNCCGVQSQTDKYGITTYFAYDQLRRQIKSNRMGVTTETVRKGLTTETHRYAETVSGGLNSSFAGTGETLVAKSVSNLAGTLRESWSPDPTSTTAGALVKSSSTATTYQPGSGLSMSSVTTVADNNSQTTQSYLDGRTFKTFGDLSPAMQFGYAVNETGEVVTQSYIDGTNLRETTATQSDWIGRGISTSYQDGAIATNEYNTLGQMVKSTDPDGVVTLMAYNAEGEQVLTAIDLDQDDAIDYGSDTVTYSETDPGLDGSNPVYISISKVWQPGDSDPAGGTVTNTSKRSPDGLSSSSQSLGVASPSSSATALGGNGDWVTTSISPDGTKQVATYTAGLLASSAQFDEDGDPIMSMSYGYDSLNRQASSNDSRTGQTTIEYLSDTQDLVAKVTDAGGRFTQYVYDVRGRRIQVDAPDTPVDESNPTGPQYANVTTTTYNPDSTVAETDGDQTYRTTHTYDYADRQVTMTTYGGTTATTTWVYTPDRGFLQRKEYDDGNGTNYTYTAAGRLLTRAWARTDGTNHIITLYAYDSGGRQIGVDYSDNTPDVLVSLDCLGRQISQSNGVAKSTFTYDATTLVLDTELVEYDYDNNGSVDFSRLIDRSQDSLLRDSGWQLKNGAITEHQATYAYGAADGRLSSVGNGSNTFGYSYIAGSNLVAGVAGPVLTHANTYETTRNVLDTKSNSVTAGVVSSYDYSVNNLGQRTNVATSGSAFAAATSWAWSFNAKGEVIKADSSTNAYDRAYQFDGIGNRIEAVDGATSVTGTANYSSNGLNQYTAIGALNPAYDVDGNMTSGPLPANTSANSVLVWDAENRLISTTVSGTTTTYQYDSQSRRIAKSTSGVTTTYVYDGWNPIAEYTAGAISKSYTWGMDMSGSMQGAGGVGGLLAVKIGAATYYPSYDGNGNVSEYVDSTGAVVAHFEYDPFGRAVVDTDTADLFSHRFSTKLLDEESGLYYYGYRYYDPETGRWPSRDPIEEDGGVNLYGFVGNDGVGEIDVLGLEAVLFKRADATIDQNAQAPPAQGNLVSSGATIATFPRTVVSVRVITDGKCWGVSASGKLQQVVEIYNPDDTDLKGQKTEAHEMNHVDINSKHWNHIARLANRAEEKLNWCNQGCADLWVDMFNEAFFKHKVWAYIENKRYDQKVYKSQAGRNLAKAEADRAVPHFEAADKEWRRLLQKYIASGCDNQPCKK